MLARLGAGGRGQARRALGGYVHVFAGSGGQFSGEGPRGSGARRVSEKPCVGQAVRTALHRGWAFASTFGDR